MVKKSPIRNHRSMSLWYHNNWNPTHNYNLGGHTKRHANKDSWPGFMYIMIDKNNSIRTTIIIWTQIAIVRGRATPFAHSPPPQMLPKWAWASTGMMEKIRKSRTWELFWGLEIFQKPFRKSIAVFCIKLLEMFWNVLSRRVFCKKL